MSHSDETASLLDNENYSPQSYLSNSPTHDDTSQPPLRAGTPVGSPGDDDSIQEFHAGVSKGLTIKACAMFIIAEIAGSGVLALAKAIAQCSWIGIGLLIFACFLGLYCGVLLGRCILILQKKYPEAQGHVRDPYPMIGLKASGKFGEYFVHFCIFMTLFGSGVVYLLLASEQISTLIDTKIGDFSIQSEFRLWVLICGAVLLPSTWLATPKDMWPFAMIATACTFLATIFIIIPCSIEIYHNGLKVPTQTNDVTTISFFTAFGTIAFAFGGAAILPSFQVDMRKPEQFSQAALLGYLGCLGLYLPAAILPYLALGDSVDDNVLKTLSNLKGSSGQVYVKLSMTFITLHLLFAFVIVVNPVAQHIEEHFQISHNFNWKRVSIRTILVLLIIGVAEALPNFSPILSLIGGSTITCLNFILPPIFYLQLKRNLPFHIKVLLGEIILVAIVCGVTSTYSAATHFQNPFKTS